MPYSYTELSKKNVTTVFLLWTVGLSYAKLEFYGFVDAFIADKHKPNNPGYFLFILKDKRKQKILKEDAFANDYLTETYYYGENLKVFKYKVPPAFHTDYEIITTGNYSKVSDDFKNAFPKYQINLNGYSEYSQRHIAQKIITQKWYTKDDLKRIFQITLNDDEEWWKAFDFEAEVLDVLKYLNSYD